MRNYLKFYIDGKWVDPASPKTMDVENPATEAVSGQISLGSAEDVDRAVKAARKAFPSWSQSSREERLISGHPDIDMVSFTGSTRAGIEVAKSAAVSVKRVCQELGGKSPNIILDDDALPANIAASVEQMMLNSGQSCNAPSRMLVPAARMDDAMSAAKTATEAVTVGDPQGDAAIGPVVNGAQFKKIQGLINKGIDEGATLVAGGPGRPEGLDKGYYVKPTVFANVTNDMTIASREWGEFGFDDYLEIKAIQGYVATPVA